MRYKRKNGEGTVRLICTYCNSEFTTAKAWLRGGKYGKFCSRSCTTKSNPKPITRVEKICLNCRQPFKVKKHRNNTAKYCSRRCKDTYPHPIQYTPKIGKVKKRRSTRPLAVRKAIKKALSETKKCEECQSPDNLCGHHKLPYSKYPELGADPTNIIILCRECHSKKHPRLAKFIKFTHKKSGITKFCEVCQTPFYCILSRKNAKYCSKICQRSRLPNRTR